MRGTCVRGMGEEDLKISFTSTTVVTSLQPLLWMALILAWITAIENPSNCCYRSSCGETRDSVLRSDPEPLLQC